MTSKHHRWQTRWRLDLQAATATHESGLIFHFTREHDGWSGRAVNLDAWQARQAMPLANLSAHAQRLAREAGAVWNNPARPRL